MRICLLYLLLTLAKLNLDIHTLLNSWESGRILLHSAYWMTCPQGQSTPFVPSTLQKTIQKL
jgi:hypothetical protein